MYALCVCNIARLYGKLTHTDTMYTAQRNITLHRHQARDSDQRTNLRHSVRCNYGCRGCLVECPPTHTAWRNNCKHTFAPCALPPPPPPTTTTIHAIPEIGCTCHGRAPVRKVVSAPPRSCSNACSMHGAQFRLSFGAFHKLVRSRIHKDSTPTPCAERTATV